MIIREESTKNAFEPGFPEKPRVPGIVVDEFRTRSERQKRLDELATTLGLPPRPEKLIIPEALLTIYPDLDGGVFRIYKGTDYYSGMDPQDISFFDLASFELQRDEPEGAREADKTFLVSLLQYGESAPRFNENERYYQGLTIATFRDDPVLGMEYKEKNGLVLNAGWERDGELHTVMIRGSASGNEGIILLDRKSSDFLSEMRSRPGETYDIAGNYLFATKRSETYWAAYDDASDSISIERRLRGVLTDRITLPAQRDISATLGDLVPDELFHDPTQPSTSHDVWRNRSFRAEAGVRWEKPADTSQLTGIGKRR